MPLLFPWMIMKLHNCQATNIYLDDQHLMSHTWNEMI